MDMPDYFSEPVEYRKWLAQIVPLPVGTVLEWISEEPHVSYNKKNSLCLGNHLLICDIQINDELHLQPAAKHVYMAVRCSPKNFQPFGIVIQHMFYVWGIAKFISEGRMRVVL